MQRRALILAAALLAPIGVCFSDEVLTQSSARLPDPEVAAWARQVRAAVQRNLKLPLDLAGNPRADVELHLASDGTIQESRLVRSSSVESWDSAVLDAVRKTERLPKASNGTIPTHSVVLAFFPKAP